MIQFLIDNKEWIFSGCGIAIISGIIFVIRKIKLGRNKEMAPFNTLIYRITPLPLEIENEIKNASLYYQDDIGKKFDRIKVQWRCSISHIHKTKMDDSVRLMLLDRGNYPWVYTSASVIKYPELKLVKKNQVIWIAGEINIGEKKEINLVCEEIKFIGLNI